MTDLGDVLELLHTSPERWDSLSLAGTHWRNLARYHEAWERSIADMQRSGYRSAGRITAVRASVQGREPNDLIVRWRLWHAKPNKIRTEFDVGTETVRAVLVGPEWWSWSRATGLRTNHGDRSSTHGVGPGEVLVNTPQLLSFLRLRAVSPTTFISRPAYLVAAQPIEIDRGGPASVLHDLGPGADRYQLMVDAETGVLLRNQAEWRGQPFHVLEVEHLGVNEPLDANLFTPEGLAG